MPSAQITAPKGGYSHTADFSLYKDADGHRTPYDIQVETYRCNETIAKYQVVSLIGATTSVPASIEIVDISDAFSGMVMIGVALEAGVAGDIIRVCTGGIVLAQVDTGDPVYGDVAIKGASDGTCTTAGTLGGTWDGSDVAGTALGWFLDVEDAANLAPVYIKKF